MSKSRITLISDSEGCRYTVVLADGQQHGCYDRFDLAKRECRNLGENNPTIVRVPRTKPRDLANFTL